MQPPSTGNYIPQLRAVTLAKLTWYHPDELEYYAPSARQHTEDHIECFADTIRRSGGALPVVTNGTGGIVAGQGRVEAARRLSIESLPTLPLAWLTEQERKHYIKTLTQFGSIAGWRHDMLQIDLQHLKKIRLSTVAKINGRFFHANGEEQRVRGQH